MKQVFILGASTVYGVGAEHAGWGDLIKRYFHSTMFTKNGSGERFEIYNFAKPGATIDFVSETFEQHFKNYSKSDNIVTIVSVGGNNSRADYEPTNYVSTPESYEQELSALIKELQSKSEKIIFVGNGWVDESKTTPFVSKRGNKYYFTNDRRQQFEEITQQICLKNGISFVEIDVPQDEWLQKYLYSDGLHPNQAGHDRFFEAVRPLLDEVIADN